MKDGWMKAGGDISQALDYFRDGGWSVAVHNDYRLNGEARTFWLFTKGSHCAKGEGASDLEALGEVMDAVTAVEQELEYIIKLKAALEPFAKAAEELDRSDEGWDDRARQRNSWFFDDDVVRAASRVLRRR